MLWASLLNAPIRVSADALPVPSPFGTANEMQISPSGSNNYLETAVALDPTNNLNLFAGANVLPTTCPTTALKSNMAVRTATAGTAWSADTGGSLPLVPGHGGLDPTAAFDTNGNLYYAYLDHYCNGSTDNPTLVVAESTDKGATWTSPGTQSQNPVQIDANTQTPPDKPWLIADPNRSKLYIAYVEKGNPQKLFVARSTDGGAWTPATVLGTGGNTGAFLGVDSSGRVLITWWDYANGRILSAVSTDGGANFSPQPVLVAKTSLVGTSGYPLPNSGSPEPTLYSNTSLDVDRSTIGIASHPSYVYAVWPDKLGNRMHIFFSRSVDFGANWSTPAQIDTGNVNNDSWEPTVAVDQTTGVVNVAWYDRRDDPANSKYRVYYTESVDGGNSFLSAQVPVASATSDPSLNSGTGDYMQMVAAHGLAHPVWSDTRSGQTNQVWTTSVSETQTASPPSPSAACRTQTIAAGNAHSLALGMGGGVSSWGHNDSGDFGYGSFASTSNVVQVVDSSGSGALGNVVSVAAGNYHSLALKSPTAGGTVWAWGYNADGELGNNDTTGTAQSRPIQVVDSSGTSFLTGIRAIGAGEYHSLAINAADGSVWTWGSNLTGELGNGSTFNGITAKPVHVLGPGGAGNLTGVVAVAGGANHSLALTSTGIVYAWGSNTYGQLGDGSTTDRYSPVQVSNLPGIVAIAAGDSDSLALDANGQVWAWGYNYDGELGNGLTSGSNPNKIPQRVLDPNGSQFLSGVTAIGMFGFHGLALKPDGTLVAWGLNAYGEVGDNSTTNRPTPVRVVGQTGIGFLSPKAVAGGYYHSEAINSQGNLGLTSDGTVSEWGFDGEGPSLPGTVNSPTPVAVSGLSGVAMPSSC